jgi:YHS domain-containing protein
VYRLVTWAVWGMMLGSMGDRAVKEYEHAGAKREVRFCCPPCIEPFEKDKDKHFAAIDEKLIEQQKAHYPLDACIVSGRKLDDSDTVHDMIHEGRLVRFCCPNCPRRFNADPDRYMVRLDEAIIKQQRERYPLNTCVVAGMELGSMGEPDEVIVGGTLVRFCCAGCRGGFRDDPVKHLTQIRDAWREQHEAANGHH